MALRQSGHCSRCRWILEASTLVLSPERKARMVLSSTQATYDQCNLLTF